MISTPSNFITDAVTANGEKYVFIASNGTPAGSQVRLSDDTKLGAVQSVKWSLEVTGYARCTIETLASPLETVALMGHTTVLVKPWGSPAVWLWTYYLAKLRGFYKGSRFTSLFRS